MVRFVLSGNQAEKADHQIVYTIFSTDFTMYTNREDGPTDRPTTRARFTAYSEPVVSRVIADTVWLNTPAARQELQLYSMAGGGDNCNFHIEKISKHRRR